MMDDADGKRLFASRREALDLEPPPFSFGKEPSPFTLWKQCRTSPSTSNELRFPDQTDRP